jgi:tetratricopeptide (TPR) repeat protein
LIDICHVGRIHAWVCAAVLLVACGRSDRPKARGEAPLLDTITRMADVQKAKERLRKGALDEAERLAGAVLDTSRSVPALARQQCMALGVLGIVQQRRSDYDSALVLHKEALRVAENAGDTLSIGTAWMNIGTVLDDQGDYDGALEAQLNALRIKERSADSLSLARVLHNLSVNHWRRDDLPAAISTLQRSIAIKRTRDTLALVGSLNGLGVLLTEAGKYDSAIAVLRESLTFHDRMAGGAEREMQLHNLGLAFEKKGVLDSAQHYYAQALQFARQHGSMDVENHALHGLAELLLLRGRYAEAGPLLDSSLVLAQKIGSLDDMTEAHDAMMRRCEALHNAECALYHYREYDRLRDSLMSVETKAAMAELRLKYDTEHKDRENQTLRAGQKLSELRAERNRWIAIGIGVIAIAIAISAWALIQRARQHAARREAELEQQALRLQMDPHFLFNALNTVPGLYASGDAMTANDHVAHLSKFLRLVLETSRRRVVPLEQEVELVEQYLRISANRKPGSFTWKVKVMPYVQADRVAIPPMLIQPLVENAIEHGFNGVQTGHVSVLVDRAGSILHLEVKDNGVGRTAAANRPSRRNGSSLGIDLVRKRIALFDRRSAPHEVVELRDERAEDGSAKGTTVIVRLRIQTLSEHAAAGDRG